MSSKNIKNKKETQNSKGKNVTGKSQWDKAYKYIILFSLIAFALINSYNYFWSISKNIPPVYSDEVAYFMDIKSFHLNNSLKTSLTGDEAVSKIGEFGTHGYAYSLVYGTFSKLFLG